MVGNLAVAHQVLWARELIGEYRGDEILGVHALQRRGHLSAPAESQHRERARRVPAPARPEDRRIEHCLHQQVLGGRRLQVVEHLVQREAVLRSQRQHDRVLGGSSLQLEVEAAAEPLAEREPPRAVDAAAERCVENELHPPRFVEEALQYERLLRRNDAKDLPAGGQVFDDLARAGLAHADRLDQPANRLRRIVQPVRDILPQPRNLFGELARAARRLADPERQRGRLPLRVRYAHLPRLDLHDLVRGVAQLEDVAGHTLDRKVLVQRADERLCRLEDHAVVAQVGNRAAGRDGREPRTAPAFEPAVHTVIVNVGTAPAAPGGEPLGEHLHDVVEFLPRQVAVRIGRAHEREQRVVGPFLARRRGDDLLCQDV